MDELNTNSIKHRRGRIAFMLGVAFLTVGLLLLLLPVPSQAQETLGVTQTVGLTSNLCASTSAIAVTANTQTHFCVTFTNSTNAVLTTHNLVLVVPQLDLTRTAAFSATLPPGQSIAVNTAYLSSIGQSVQLSASASRNFTSTVTATSTNGEGTTVSGTATARVAIGSVGMTIVKTISTVDDPCGAVSGLAVNQGATVYYCVTVIKSGTLPLVRHHLVDPALGVDVTITDTTAIIADNQPVAITSQTLRTLRPPNELKKTVTQNFTNTVTLTSYTAEGVAVTAQAAAHVLLGSTAIVVTDTVGTRADECATTATLTVVAGATVYHCIRITNRGTIPLTRHQIVIPLLNLNSVVTQTIRAGAVLTLTSSTLPQLKRTVNAAETSTVNVTSTNVNKVIAQDSGTAQISLGTAGLVVIKYPQKNPNTCNKDASLSLVSNDAFYYCLVVRNNGQVPLVSHSFSEPNLSISGSFSYTLGAGQLLTLTNQFLVDTLKVNPGLGPFRTATSLNNALTYNARTAANTALVASPINAPITIVAATPTGTTAPTAIPTFTLTPTPSLTISPTPIPTFTPTTVVLSLPATPASPFNLNSIETPTPGVPGSAQDNTFNSPVETPFFPTPDDVATTFALTAEAAATQTSFALFASPLPTAIETPTPPLLTPTVLVESASPTALMVVAVTPTAFAPAVVFPTVTPAPIADYLNLVAGVLAVSTATLGWIWFMVGSIIFFAVAGIFAGLTFRRQERHRYDTAEQEEASFPLLDEPALSSAGSLYYMTDDAGAGYTVATSSARGPVRTESRNEQGRAHTPTDDLESDDFWPASLR